MYFFQFSRSIMLHQNYIFHPTFLSSLLMLFTKSVFSALPTNIFSTKNPVFQRPQNSSAQRKGGEQEDQQQQILPMLDPFPRRRVRRLHQADNRHIVHFGENLRLLHAHDNEIAFLPVLLGVLLLRNPHFAHSERPAEAKEGRKGIRCSGTRRIITRDEASAGLFSCELELQGSRQQRELSW